MSTATIGRPIHKPAAKRPPAGRAETDTQGPAGPAKTCAPPVGTEDCGKMYDTVLSCTLDIEIWTSD